MPGPVRTSASTILCTHGGSASVSPSNTNVMADGAPILHPNIRGSRYYH
jgi:archaellum component FlaF (FlaF/FlaG flagellin family)